jgi:hypothetical protein
MTAATAPRPLADREMDELVRVEQTFADRADTNWSIERYLNAVSAVHDRYTHVRHLAARRTEAA